MICLKNHEWREPHLHAVYHFLHHPSHLPHGCIYHARGEDGKRLRGLTEILGGHPCCKSHICCGARFTPKAQCFLSYTILHTIGTQLHRSLQGHRLVYIEPIWTELVIHATYSLRMSLATIKKNKKYRLSKWVLEKLQQRSNGKQQFKDNCLYL